MHDIIKMIKQGVAYHISTKIGYDIENDILNPIFDLADKNLIEEQRSEEREFSNDEVVQFLIGRKFSDIIDEKMDEERAEKIIGVISEVVEDVEKNKWEKVNGLLDEV